MEAKTYKENILEGVRVGLIAFLICFVVILVAATIINYIYIDDVNRILNGSLSGNPTPTLGSLLLIVSLVLNLSMFNNGGVLVNGGSLHIGLLIFLALPIIAFMIADRRDNKKQHFNLEDMMIYCVSSVVYSIVLYLFSVIAQGKLLGVEINFSSPLNFIMTIIIVLSIQFFIGLNYNKAFSPGIKKTRSLLRVLIGIGLVLGLIGLVVGLFKYVGDILISVLTIILLLPNIAVYIMFIFMGVNVDLGEDVATLQKFVNYAMSSSGLEITSTSIPLSVRLVFVVFFFAFVLYSIWKLKSEHFLEEVLLFATSFSLISLILAYMTKMNLGVVKNLIDIQFGIDYVAAFVIPFVVIILAGLAVLLFRYLSKEIKSEPVETDSDHN